jgi:hypothetical protein
MFMRFGIMSGVCALPGALIFFGLACCACTPEFLLPLVLGRAIFNAR